MAFGQKSPIFKGSRFKIIAAKIGITGPKYQKSSNLNINNEYILGWTGRLSPYYKVFTPSELDRLITEDEYKLWRIKYNSENTLWDITEVDE